MQVGFFLRTGYYMKSFAALPKEKLFVIVTNTNLGMSNERQNAALAADLAWVKAQGGRVYLIGHHPQTVGCLWEHDFAQTHGCGGDRFIPPQFRSIIRGVFAGHIHSSAPTNLTSLFTQVGSLDQAGSDSFFIANITSANDYAILLDPNEPTNHMAYDRSKVGEPSAAQYWQPSHHPHPHPLPPSPPTPTPPVPPVPPVGNGTWECFSDQDNHYKLIKSPYSLKDDDISSGVLDLQGCKDRCNVSNQCLVIVWHAGDRHCHVLSGKSVTAAQFVATLQPEKESWACFDTQGHVGPLPPPTPPSPPLPPAPPLQPYGPGTLPIKPLGSWMVIGDWGGEEDAPFAESGQLALARQMGFFAANASTWSPVSDFVGLGDNFCE